MDKIIYFFQTWKKQGLDRVRLPLAQDFLFGLKCFAQGLNILEENRYIGFESACSDQMLAVTVWFKLATHRSPV